MRANDNGHDYPDGPPDWHIVWFKAKRYGWQAQEHAAEVRRVGNRWLKVEPITVSEQFPDHVMK